MFNPVLVIPFYNHFDQFISFLPRVKETGLPCILIDDGSDLDQSERVERLCRLNQIDYMKRPCNSGKGKAVITGIVYASQKGYSHAVQVDADGQHDLSCLKNLLQLAQQNQRAVVCAQPVYDTTIPKGRLYGRKITNFWVQVETACQLKMDTMCGFRIYPINQIVPILKTIRFFRMGFDIEILVKAYWLGLTLLSENVPVHYDSQGLSHFRMIQDNLQISLLHTYLCFLSPFFLLKRWLKK